MLSLEVLPLRTTYIHISHIHKHFRIVEPEIGSSKPPSYMPILANTFCLSKQGCILGGVEYPIPLS